MLMSKEKQASVWWVAILHTLFSYIATALLVVIIIFPLSLAVGMVAPDFDVEAFGLTPAGMIVIALIGLLLLWWATANSAKILSKKYVVTDARTLLYGSTALYLVLIAATELLFPSETGLGTWEVTSVVLGVLVFFLVTKKYFTDR